MKILLVYRRRELLDCIHWAREETRKEITVPITTLRGARWHYSPPAVVYASRCGARNLLEVPELGDRKFWRFCRHCFGGARR